MRERGERGEGKGAPKAEDVLSFSPSGPAPAPFFCAPTCGRATPVHTPSHAGEERPGERREGRGCKGGRKGACLCWGDVGKSPPQPAGRPHTTNRLPATTPSQAVPCECGGWDLGGGKNEKQGFKHFTQHMTSTIARTLDRAWRGSVPLAHDRGPGFQARHTVVLGGGTAISPRALLFHLKIQPARHTLDATLQDTLY